MTLKTVGGFSVVFLFFAILGKPLVNMLDQVWLSKPLVLTLDPAAMEVIPDLKTLDIYELPNLENIQVKGIVVTLVVKGTEFPLGFSNSDSEYRRYLIPDSTDIVKMKFQHSVFGWWTPLSGNFMGPSPTSKRNSYYTLTWLKADGRQLRVRWKMEQHRYFDHDWLGWQNPSPADNDSGLIEMIISP